MFTVEGRRSEEKETKKKSQSKPIKGLLLLLLGAVNQAKPVPSRAEVKLNRIIPFVCCCLLGKRKCFELQRWCVCVSVRAREKEKGAEVDNTPGSRNNQREFCL